MGTTTTVDEEDREDIVPRPKWTNYSKGEFEDLKETQRLDIILYHLSQENWKTVKDLQQKIFQESCLKYSILRILHNTLEDVVECQENNTKRYRLTREINFTDNRGLGELIEGCGNHEGYNCLECRRKPLNAIRAKKHKSKMNHYYWELKQKTY